MNKLNAVKNKLLAVRRKKTRKRKNFRNERARENEKSFHPFVVMDLFCHKFALFKRKTFRAFFIIV